MLIRLLTEEVCLCLSILKSNACIKELYFVFAPSKCNLYSGMYLHDLQIPVSFSLFPSKSLCHHQCTACKDTVSEETAITAHPIIAYLSRRSFYLVVILSPCHLPACNVDHLIQSCYFSNTGLIMLITSSSLFSLLLTNQIALY